MRHQAKRVKPHVDSHCNECGKEIGHRKSVHEYDESYFCSLKCVQHGARRLDLEENFYAHASMDIDTAIAADRMAKGIDELSEWQDTVGIESE